MIDLPVSAMLCTCCVVLFRRREKINDLCVAKNWLIEEESCALEGISDVLGALGINDGMDF